ncbi:hypothetical protein COI68_30295 [Priestia megaterium]|uniref:hypothetical protein n=1 Tax=Priestia megaterium TaxID=1404 RepID=UPI000BF9A006|nr:hypothetical protein [Priestia megaterium]PFI53531.1 hypothetical protein COI68_30295 [Priestia megaterium]
MKINKIIFKNISISGILVIILAVLIGVFGYKDYEAKETAINLKYNYLLSTASITAINNQTGLAIDQLQIMQENDPKKRAIAIKEATLRKSEAIQEIKNQTKLLEEQREEELDNRFFDLMAYVSFAISILVFGISLFWRKKDVNNSKLFEEAVLEAMAKQNLNIEKLRNIQAEQNKNFKSLQTTNPNSNSVKKRKKRKGIK